MVSLEEQLVVGGLRFVQCDSEEDEEPLTASSNPSPMQGVGIRKEMLWRRLSVLRAKVGRRIVIVVRVDDAKHGCQVKASLAVGKAQIQELTSKQEAPMVMATEYVASIESANLFFNEFDTDAEIPRPTQGDDRS